MQPKNLGWKFAFVGLLVAISVYVIWAKELRQGIDLKGGHILTFEIRSNGQKTPDLAQKVIDRLKERIDPSGTRALEWRPVGGDRFEVRMPLGTAEARRAKQAYLRALKDIERGNMRRSDLSRIVSLTGQARAQAIARISGNDTTRAQALEKISRTHDAQTLAKERLDALMRAGDASAEALATARADYDDAAVEYAAAVREMFALDVNIQHLGQILSLYVSKRQADVLAAKEVQERREKFAEQLDRLRLRYPARRAQIDAVVRHYEDWSDRRTGLDDPADLKRMVARAGVLEFRIAPTLPLVSGATPRGTEITEAEHQARLEQLAEQGPLAGRGRGESYLWFPVYGKGRRLSPELVVGKYAGKKYVLLYNQDGYMMLREPGKRSWSLTASAGRDAYGQPSVTFKLDPRGAKLMGILTNAHKEIEGQQGQRPGHLMAILLDDEMYSAPQIKSTITSSGEISGDFTTQEVNDLVRILNAGALEGRVNENPVSEKTVAPGIGKDNRDAGLRAAMWGLIAVAAFMVLYYLAAGAVADVALMLNLLFLLGAMSFIEAVFTLPGIAGVILTIGIAVDANVLIFERLREEQRKTQSMRMAIRNAYSNAARAIFDGNITTLLTCFILGWVGTEEVRGFAITLGFGVLFSLFTSLLVTRWIFELGLEIGLIKDRIRMAAFIGVPKIDWIGKRRIFWAVSLVLIVVGIVSLVKQGSGIMGIEFSSGTQAMFRVKPGSMVPGAGGGQVLPRRSAIEAVLKDRARLLGERAGDSARGADLISLADTAKVETLLDTDKISKTMDRFDSDGDGKITLAEWTASKGSKEFFAELDADGDGAVTRAELEARLPERTYQVSTTVADVDLLREVIESALGGALDAQRSVQFELQKTGHVAGLNIELDKQDDGMTHISSALADVVGPEVRARVIDGIGGAMFVVRNVNPPLREADLAKRIQTMRLQPDYADRQFNRTIVIGLQASADQEGFSTLALIVLAPNADYAGRPDEWRNFATGELDLIGEALRRNESLEAVSEFDPAIAGKTKWQAGFAFFLSWVAIIVYLWLRFGSVRWGLAAVLSLVHDVIIAVGMVALAGFIHDNVIGRLFLVQPFKIDMAVVAAFLTIIGYSVNDTIVVFDRIRENRGRLATVDEATINRSINQTISRTLLTSMTTLLAVAIMYIWGGAGIHAFTYALLVGIIVGTYSSIAIASPLLLGLKKALAGRAATASTASKAGK